MSQLEPHPQEIDGKIFEVYKLPPKTSQRMLIALVKMLGPAGGELASVLGTGDLKALLSSDLTGLGDAISKLAVALDPDSIEAVQDAMAEVTFVTYTESDKQNRVKLAKVFDIVFLGDLPLMYRWLAHAIKVQWGNFAGLASKLPGGEARSAEQSPSPITSRKVG